jgi:hypothetical protein
LHVNSCCNKSSKLTQTHFKRVGFSARIDDYPSSLQYFGWVKMDE